MIARFIALLLLGLLVLSPARADDPWIKTGADGQPQVQLYFFWALTCPHCARARPFVEAIPQERPWVALRALELTRHPENVRLYEAMAARLGEEAASVPALLFCGEMIVGWDSDATTGAFLRQRLDACQARVGRPSPAATAPAPPEPLRLPLLGAVNASSRKGKDAC